MYLDVARKMQFHKERIIKDFISKGIGHNNKAVVDKLNSIDGYLSLFKHYDKNSGYKFRTNEYNECMNLIYNDIKILYSIINDELKKEYERTQGFVQGKLNELTTVVNSYYTRAISEASTTAIGNSIFYKDNSFTIDIDNDITSIDLGNISIEEGAEIACLIDGENIKYDNILFEFTNGKDVVEGPAFNKYNQKILFPGTKSINTYNYTIPEKQNITKPVLINIGKDASHSNSYTILGGKDKISVGLDILDLPKHLEDTRYLEASHINFYVVGGSTARFKFNKKPIAANFSIEDDEVKNLDEVHHFFISAPEDFQFSIEINKGSIYAINDKGIVNNGELFYINEKEVRDFNVIERTSGKSNAWAGRIKIIDNNTSDIIVKSITVKEIK